MRPRRQSGASGRPLSFTVRRLAPMPSPYVIAYIAAGALALLCLVLLHFLFERLASRHASTWESLGSPEFFSRVPPATGWNVLRFLGRREYLSLKDPTTTALALGASALLIVVLLVSLYLQAVFFRNGGRWPAV